MLKEYLILTISVLITAILSSLILAFIFSPLAAKFLKRPFSYKHSWLYLVLQDTLGHWLMLLIYFMLGGYRPAVSPVPQFWLENLAAILFIGLALNKSWLKNKGSIPNLKGLGLAAWGTFLILVKDAIMLACFYWYMTRP
ncbi:hypothetical protein [Dethiosulfatarculus sandiegensis]|uniref:Uncharacterized protein n=1 Tax=Dethiosulfatarculus sandiegensis TaxID=1429043 RepID=A0A0D2JFY6_9BACT|nr:hypothetical protein [Dethiosulfatarculus sandiegensis]KIX14611.1 hypothetical protein X474_07550 [Dethiosulfatarculus sandiegensis]